MMRDNERCIIELGFGTKKIVYKLLLFEPIRTTSRVNLNLNSAHLTIEPD
jgi:hypothetical protein